MARGGARQGAGRKARGEELRVTITARVDAKTKQKIQSLKEQGWKMGEALDEWIKGIWIEN